MANIVDWEICKIRTICKDPEDVFEADNNPKGIFQVSKEVILQLSRN